MGDCSRVRELVAATILCLAFAPVSLAAVMVPTNLGPGGQYQHTFVTGTTTDATSTVVSDYNNFATGDVTPAGGELTALGLRWRALEFKVGPDVGANPDSQSSTVAGDGSMGVPVSLLNDRRLVDSDKDLWDGRGATAFSITEFTVSTPDKVHTGIRHDGTGFTAAPLGQKKHLGSSEFSSFRRNDSSPDESSKRSTFWAWLKYPLWVVKQIFDFIFWIRSFWHG